jgi:hypothetical protein
LQRICAFEAQYAPHVHKKALEAEVLPLLKKQPGFQDKIVFGNEGDVRDDHQFVGYKKHAEAYDTNACPQVPKGLEKALDGQPRV